MSFSIGVEALGPVLVLIPSISSSDSEGVLF